MSRHPLTLALLLLGLVPLAAAAQQGGHPQHAAQVDHAGHDAQTRHADHGRAADRSGPVGHAAHAGQAPHTPPAAQDHPDGHGEATHAAPTQGCTPAHAAMGHCTPGQSAEVDAEPPVDGDPHRGHGAPSAPDAALPDACTPAHAAMGHCTPAADAAPREPIPPLTDADRAAAFPTLEHAHMAHGATTWRRLDIDHLEAWDDGDARGQAWEGKASWGGDIHRAWLRSSGERSGGHLESAQVELRYSRAVARWWDVVAGLRRDWGEAPSRTRLGVGVQGIAPYLFEVSAIAYAGEGGGVSADLEAEYDLRFTNRLVLQPALEVELNTKDDPQRGIGRGLSTVEAGLRLRYEVTRRFAPYVGVVHERAFGRTADLHAGDGEAARDTRWVAGVKLWF